MLAIFVNKKTTFIATEKIIIFRGRLYNSMRKKGAFIRGRAFSRGRAFIQSNTGGKINIFLKIFFFKIYYFFVSLSFFSPSRSCQSTSYVLTAAAIFSCICSNNLGLDDVKRKSVGNWLFGSRKLITTY